MRKIVTGLLALLLTLATAAQPAGEPGIDDFYPNLGNGGYDVRVYDIVIDIDDALTEITAVTTITLVATADISAFNLDFLGMTVDSVHVDDEAATFSREGRELTINAPLTKGETYTVAVAYHGIPGADVEAELHLPFNVGWRRHRGGIYVASQPAGAALWFPSNDHPIDKALFRFEITVPQPYIVAANGQLIRTIEADERTTYIWLMDYPMATYLATVNVNQFTVIEGTTAGGIQLRSYFPQQVAALGEQVFARQGEMMDYFASLFGAYPFDVYGAVVAGVVLDFALETQTLSLFGINILWPDMGETFHTAEVIIAHEAAHQWFGNSMTPASWRDLWLSEGFASYAHILWVEHNNPETAQQMLGSYYRDIRSLSLTDNPPADPTPDNLFSQAVYRRGAWTLHALRLHVGDAVFFDILKTFVASHFGYSNATTQDFIDFAVIVSGDPSVADLLHAWLYEKPVPDVPQMGLFGTR